MCRGDQVMGSDAGCMHAPRIDDAWRQHAEKCACSSKARSKHASIGAKHWPIM